MPHKLLLADDSVTIQRVIELTFADEDVQVIAVGNGQQAIERAERERPDIVLADVGMPERDGYDVAAFIKGNPALAHVPVVLLTGAFEPIDETRARAVGCDGVLVKPFEPQMVISRVKDLLAGRKPAGLWGSGPSAQGPVRPATGNAELRPVATTHETNATDPLEAYFDRLDAAFTSLGTADAPSLAPPAPQASPQPTPPAPTPPPRSPIPVPGNAPAAAPPAANREQRAADLSSWDPQLEGDPVRAAAPSSAAVEPPRPTPVAAATPAAPPPAPAPTPMAAPFDPAQAGGFESTQGRPGAPPSLVDAFAALLSAEQRLQIAPSTAPGRQNGAPVITEQVIDEIAQRVLARLSDETRPTVLDVAERLVREEIERIKQQR
jgi:CheY-like chemotaxis protein